MTEVMLVSVTVEDASLLRAIAFAELQRWRNSAKGFGLLNQEPPEEITARVAEHERLYDLLDGWVEGRG